MSDKDKTKISENNPESTAETAASAMSDEQKAANIERLADDMCHEEESLNVAELAAQLDVAILDAAKNKDLYLHAIADLDTYRRKVQREKQELSKYALQPLIEELLPSMDHLDMAIEASKSSGESKNLITGVEMVSSQIKKVLENFGVKEIDVIGKDFDPNNSDCVAHEASKEHENKVLKVTRKGYTYNGRLLRPASVIVSSGKKD